MVPDCSLNGLCMFTECSKCSLNVPRLYKGLLAMSVVLVVCYRFVMKNGFLEFVAWLMFLFLEVYPKLYVGSANTFYESDKWQQGVTVPISIMINMLKVKQNSFTHLKAHQVLSDRGILVHATNTASLGIIPPTELTQFCLFLSDEHPY